MAGLSTAYDDADRSPGLMLWRVTNRWQAAMRLALAPFDLTHVQFVLLASLAWLCPDGPARREPVTQRDLAAHARTDPMMTSQVLRALEGKGLVRRAPHPKDARARSLEITSSGRQLADAAVTAVEQADAGFFGLLDEAGEPFVAALQALDRAAR